MAVMEIGKITIEPFFDSCQPETLWRLWGHADYYDLSIRTVIIQRFSVSRQNGTELQDIRFLCELSCLKKGNVGRCACRTKLTV